MPKGYIRPGTTSFIRFILSRLHGPWTRQRIKNGLNLIFGHLFEQFVFFFLLMPIFIVIIVICCMGVLYNVITGKTGFLRPREEIAELPLPDTSDDD